MQTQKLPPERLLEWHTARALERQGYRARPKSIEELGNVLVQGGDRQRQVDVYAVRTDLFRTENLLVECKCHQGKIPVNDAEVFSTSVREIRGSLSGSVQGLFVSISELTPSAKAHLQKQGIEIIEGTDVRNFIGDAPYNQLTSALLKAEDAQQYYGKVSFPTETIVETLRIDGVETISIDRVEGRYDPVVYFKAGISCKREMQSIRKPIVYNRQVVFTATLREHKPEIHDTIDGVSTEALSKEAANLDVTPSQRINEAIAIPVLSDPLVYSPLVAEACRRGRGVIYYSELLEDWAENAESLRARAFDRISDLEETETRERKVRDEDRLFDLEQKTAETEADLEAHRTELAAISGLEETARQTRHRASLQAKASRAERLLRDYRSQKSRLSERLSNDLNAIGRKFEKIRNEAIKQFLVEPEASEVSTDAYIVCIPKFQATGKASIGSKCVEIQIKWNGMTGAVDLGRCKTCGVSITTRGASLCFACMSLICLSHTQRCSHCSRLLCKDDVWICPLCNRTLCQEEQRFVCSSCKTTGCLDCRFVCTECGSHLCKKHVFACNTCGRTLCNAHKFSCDLCSCTVCSLDLEVCTGCKRHICRNHFVICPKCGMKVCNECLRAKTTVRAVLGGKLRETRCVFCLNR